MNVVEAIKSSARKGCSPETRVLRQERDFPYGKYVRQGDLMIQRLPLKNLKQFSLAGEASRQLAPGTETGSKHIVRPGPKVHARQNASPLEGAVIEAPEGLYIEHPKHAHFDIGLPGCYVVTYQRDLSAEGVQRVRD